MGRLSTHVSRVTRTATSDEETDLDGRCPGYVFRSRAACAARVAQQNNDMGSCTGQGSRMSQCFPSFWGSVLCRNPRYRVLRIAMISQGMTCSPHIAVNPCPLVHGIHAILSHVHVFDSHQSRVPALRSADVVSFGQLALTESALAKTTLPTAPAPTLLYRDENLHTLQREVRARWDAWALDCRSFCFNRAAFICRNENSESALSSFFLPSTLTSPGKYKLERRSSSKSRKTCEAQAELQVLCHLHHLGIKKSNILSVKKSIGTVSNQSETKRIHWGPAWSSTWRPCFNLEFPRYCAGFHSSTLRIILRIRAESLKASTAWSWGAPLSSSSHELNLQGSYGSYGVKLGPPILRKNDDSPPIVSK